MTPEHMQPLWLCSRWPPLLGEKIAAHQKCSRGPRASAEELLSRRPLGRLHGPRAAGDGRTHRARSPRATARRRCARGRTRASPRRARQVCEEAIVRKGLAAALLPPTRIASSVIARSQPGLSQVASLTAGMCMAWEDRLRGEAAQRLVGCAGGGRLRPAHHQVAELHLRLASTAGKSLLCRGIAFRRGRAAAAL